MRIVEQNPIRDSFLNQPPIKSVERAEKINSDKKKKEEEEAKKHKEAGKGKILDIKT